MVTPCDTHLYKGVMTRRSIKCPKTHRRVQHDKRTPAAVQPHSVQYEGQPNCVCVGVGLNFVMHLSNPTAV